MTSSTNSPGDPPHTVVGSVTVSVPGTSANLGPGFDALGVALDWRARITLHAGPDAARAPSPDPIVAAIEGMATRAASVALEAAGARAEAVSATYEGDMPVGRGLGMSAASRAAGLVAGNRLLGDALGEQDLVPLAVRLEGHGDNIIPALFGGLQVVVHTDDHGGHGAVHVPITPPDDLRLALLVPEFSMPTEESRKRLPTSLTRQQAVANIGRTAMIVAALSQRRYDVLRVAVEDVLHQPARGELFPAMYPIIHTATDAGAYGAYLSGGGSTVAAFVSPEAGERVASAMAETAAQHGLQAFTRVVALSARGTEVVA